jgi:hypothetical protein
LYESIKTVQVELASLSPGSSGGAVGAELDLQPPDAATMSESFRPQPLSTLSIIAEAVHQDESLWDPAAESDRPLGRGQGGGDVRQGSGDASGDGRAQRWELRFDGGSLQEYAAQLDFFGIELGVLSDGNQLQYASNFRQNAPRTRTDFSGAEKRLYMTWRSGGLKEADRQLLRRAGVDTTRREIIQFYPPQTEAMLADAERRFAMRRSVESIRRTVFGVRQSGEGYEFFVLEQTYKN